MRFFYTLGIYLYYFSAWVFSFFNNKAKKWIIGQKDIIKNTQNIFKRTDKVAWFHAASLGEFEQGRPVIEAFKSNYPDYKIIITFFSPSGYEIRKNYEHADYVSYLPIDTFYKATNFINNINPDIVFFIKYEFWFNYLNILNTKKIPTYLISGIFRENQHFFKVWGFWFRKQLTHFTHFFVQNNESFRLLKNIGLHNVTISGDTRFDRVGNIAENPRKFPLIEKFIDFHQVILAGSSWEYEENILIEFIQNFNSSYKYIIAPHEIHEEHISQIQSKLTTKALLFSELNEFNYSQSNILIINNIGILSHLYQYADIAFIGGGFGKGIHNILEAATFGVPSLFGPNYQKFTEAKELIELKGAFSVLNFEEFKNITLDLLGKADIGEKVNNINKKYIETKKGSTEIIIKNIHIERLTY